MRSSGPGVDVDGLVHVLGVPAPGRPDAARDACFLHQAAGRVPGPVRVIRGTPARAARCSNLSEDHSGFPAGSDAQYSRKLEIRSPWNVRTAISCIRLRMPWARSSNSACHSAMAVTVDVEVQQFAPDVRLRLHHFGLPVLADRFPVWDGILQHALVVGRARSEERHDQVRVLDLSCLDVGVDDRAGVLPGEVHQVSLLASASDRSEA